MKKVLTYIVCLSLCFIISGCSDINDDSSVKNESKSNIKNEVKVYTFDDLKKDLTDIDSTTEVIRKEASYIGGIEGYGYKMNGCTIEVYKFDKNSQEYKEAESKQKLTMPSFNNMSFDAIVKNGYAYSISDGNCDSIVSTVEKIMK